MSTASINPFFSASLNRAGAAPMSMERKAVYAKLPVAPINASPVPHLTSLSIHTSYFGPSGGRLVELTTRACAPPWSD